MDGQYYGIVTSQDGYLMHHGIKGQRWGRRRYQNADGSLTSEGRNHYRLMAAPDLDRAVQDQNRATMATGVIASKNYVQSGLVGAVGAGIKANMAAGASPAIAALCASPAIAGMTLGVAASYAGARAASKAVNNAVKSHALKKLYPGKENKQVRKELLKKSNRIESNGKILKYDGYKANPATYTVGSRFGTSGQHYEMSKTSKSGKTYSLNLDQSKKDFKKAYKQQRYEIKADNKAFKKNKKYAVQQTPSYEQQLKELEEMERFERSNSNHFNNGGDYSTIRKRRN